MLPKGQLVGQFTAKYVSELKEALDKTPIIRVQRKGQYEETIACLGYYVENDGYQKLTVGEEYVFTPVYEAYGYRTTVNSTGQTMVVYTATPVKKPAEPKSLAQEAAVDFVNNKLTQRTLKLGEIDDIAKLETLILSEAQSIIDAKYNETVEITAVTELDTTAKTCKLVFTEKEGKKSVHTTGVINLNFTVK